METQESMLASQIVANIKRYFKKYLHRDAPKLSGDELQKHLLDDCESDEERETLELMFSIHNAEREHRLSMRSYVQAHPELDPSVAMDRYYEESLGNGLNELNKHIDDDELAKEDIAKVIDDEIEQQADVLADDITSGVESSDGGNPLAEMEAEV